MDLKMSLFSLLYSTKENYYKETPLPFSDSLPPVPFFIVPTPFSCQPKQQKRSSGQLGRSTKTAKQLILLKRKGFLTRGYITWKGNGLSPLNTLKPSLDL